MKQSPKQPEENDALWELLGKSRPPQASPLFAAKVVNLARSESRSPLAWFSWLFRPALAFATLAVAALTLTPFFTSSQETRLADQDFEIIVELDNLIAMDQQTLWTDSSAYFNY